VEEVGLSADLTCRFCSAPLGPIVLDLGLSPPSNALIEPENVGVAEEAFPLQARLCEACGLVQLPQFQSAAQIFRDYAYFSSYSSTWLAHARRFADDVIGKLWLGAKSLVVELASNDGYLLKQFRERGIGVLGIEPARNVAHAARSSGIPTLDEFFGTDLARTVLASSGPADLIVANNVLAHVPDLNDFVAGIALLLAPDGVASLEFPHLLRTVERGEFDTFYHEHFSYFTLTTARSVFAAHGLRVVDVEELPTHGGSLRLFAKRSGDPSADVERVCAAEGSARLSAADGFEPLSSAAARCKRELLDFFEKARRDGKRVAGYGAPAKATTLLNYCGIGPRSLEYTVDKNPRKQGRFVPGVRVPIHAPQRIFESQPDYVLVLPWNIAREIESEMDGIAGWGGRFVVAIPQLEISAAGRWSGAGAVSPR
jgi:SAM-dependent methyltransferase